MPCTSFAGVVILTKLSTSVIEKSTDPDKNSISMWKKSPTTLVDKFIHKLWIK
jgi:hypothetical protein